MRNKTLIVIATVLYVQAAFLTGSYRANNVADDSLYRADSDVIAGLLWPIYWNMHLTLWVTG